ncbi:MAG: FGGY-family carbohydrate kinase [Clostridiales bacterium]|nr:FGGY-family carbohydrate kinase [Clostridiales bacterium]
MGRYYLGFDAGTQSVKVAVYDEKMNCVVSSSAPTTLTYPHPGWVAMDCDEYLALAIQGMRNCAQKMREQNLDPAEVRSIMGDGIICGICGVDADGNAITPYINYLDSRTEEDAQLINSWNLDIWGKETGNPEANCMFPALFARWFLKNSPEYQEKGVKFIHNAPYILAHLAGLRAEDMFIDWGAMSGWGMGYKVEEKCWSKEQLELLGIPESMMPKIVKPWDVIGYLTEEIAEKTGFPAGIPVCGGAGDTMQSMIGSGNMQPGQAVDVAGTCSMFCVSTSGIIPELSRKGAGLIFNSGTLPDTYFYWGYIRTGGLALRWYKDNICRQEADGDYYQVLSEQASAIAPGSNGVLFLPYLTGGTNDIKDASGCFLNMTMDTDQAVLWRAVLEAIGYDYMEITDLYRSAGIDLSRISITEGGSRDKLWNQMKADMLDSRTVTLENAAGAVMTNCLFGAYAVGDITDIKGALTENLHIKNICEPNAENHAFYRKMYELKTRRVKEELAQAFRTLKEIQS